MAVNARDWMQAKEDHYRPLLKNASLVVEANYSQVDVERILEAFGARLLHIKRQGGMSWHRAFEGYPACLLVGMVGTAATAPESNTFWPEFWRNVDHAPIVEEQVWIGNYFLSALGKFELPSFSDVVKHRFVGPAAMHAAVPASAMPRLVDLVLGRRRLDPGVNGSGLLSWLLGHDSRWGQIDRTVGRFLQHGGELAVDVLDRIIEVVAHAGDAPASLDDGSLTTDTTGLPTVMLTALLDSLRDRVDEVTAQPRRVGKERSQAARSTVRLDVSSGAVVLQLPAVSAEQGPALWTIAADGATEEIRCDAQWVGQGATTSARATVLRRPTRLVNVRLRGAEEADHRLVDPSDPLLLFDLDGNLLPPHLAIPRGELWAVTPDGREVVNSAGAPVKVLGDLGEPVGWTGWSIRSIDVGSAAAIHLGGDGDPLRRRMVRDAGVPTFEMPAPLTALTTHRGLRVLAERPLVLLPPGADPTQWQVEVVSSAGGWKTSQRLSLAECESRGRGWDPLSNSAGPLLGDFFISVRGAFGKKSQCMVSMAEGLGVTVEPELRRPVAGRLQSAAVRLSADSRMSVSTSAFTLDGDQAQAVLTCRVGDTVQELVVVPPAVQIRLVAEGAPAVWGSTPPAVHADMLEKTASLYVRLPGDGSQYRLEFTASRGDERQSVESTGRRGQDSRMYDLSRFVETARGAQAGTFTLTSVDSSFPVALLRPRRFAAGVRPVEGGLQLEDYHHVTDLQAAVYLCTAPWVGPREVPVTTSGLVSLPSPFLAAGPLRVALAVADPWAPTEWPDWPGEDALTCPSPGHYENGSPGLDALSVLLAGEESGEGLVLSELPAVWEVFRLYERLELPAERRQQVRQVLLDAVSRDPSASLGGLLRSSRDHASAIQLLIRSGLTEHRFESVVAADLSVGWATAPVLAALGAVPLAGRGAAWAEVAPDVELHGGASLASILTTGRDPDRQVGGFGPGARAMDQLPAARVEEIWRAVQVVPEGLLHGDSRIAAAKQLFDVRHDKHMRPVITLIAQAFPRIRRLLQEVAPATVSAQLDARLDDSFKASWELLPAASFAWAALARLRARTPSAVPFSPGNRHAWSELARLAPDYVGMDLVLADALLQSAHTRDGKAEA